VQDISELRQRIEQAATGLESVEVMRRDQNATLGDTLAKVEERFNARRLELGYLRDRIDELLGANQGLTDTIETFSNLIQAESEDQVESALFRASAGARELLAAIDNGTLSRRPSPLAMFDRMRFDNVTEEELAAEELADFPALPAPVAAELDDEIGIPEIAEAAESPKPEQATIHDLLARLHRRAAA